MAVTKILARKGRLNTGINYSLNGDKTEERVLTARLNCSPGRKCRQMLDTKRAVGNIKRSTPVKKGTNFSLLSMNGYPGKGVARCWHTPQNQEERPLM